MCFHGILSRFFLELTISARLLLTAPTSQRIPMKFRQSFNEARHCFKSLSNDYHQDCIGTSMWALNKWKEEKSSLSGPGQLRWEFRSQITRSFEVDRRRPPLPDLPKQNITITRNSFVMQNRWILFGAAWASSSTMLRAQMSISRITRSD